MMQSGAAEPAEGGIEYQENAMRLILACAAGFAASPMLYSEQLLWGMCKLSEATGAAPPKAVTWLETSGRRFRSVNLLKSVFFWVIYHVDAEYIFLKQFS